MVSPRAAHITADVSSESTQGRGIFHLRNETLCRDYNRLHILTGENLCSDLSLWLTIAMTVLVVALVEAEAPRVVVVLHALEGTLEFLRITNGLRNYLQIEDFSRFPG